MKYLPLFNELLNCKNSDKVFDFLTNNFNHSITFWDYFVNWDTVINSTNNLEMDLNTLNYLVGKQDIEREFKRLLRLHPNVLRLIPILLACRDCDFEILTDSTSSELKGESYCFSKTTSLTDKDIDKACQFAKNTRLLEMFQNKLIKSVPDYVFGIEVGLDTHSRKNRRGKAMEIIVNNLLQAICMKHSLPMISQASTLKIKRKWGISIQSDKQRRQFDFAVLAAPKLFLIETNYYSGGGSKLKSTAGEYTNLGRLLSQQGHTLIWITDGQGWNTALHPLREAFDSVDFTLNLTMVTKKVLERILIET